MVPFSDALWYQSGPSFPCVYSELLPRAWRSANSRECNEVNKCSACSPLVDTDLFVLFGGTHASHSARPISCVCVGVAVTVGPAATRATRVLASLIMRARTRRVGRGTSSMKCRPCRLAGRSSWEDATSVFTRAERSAATCGTCRRKFSAFASVEYYSKIW